LAHGAGRQPLFFFTTRQAVVIRPRRITLDEYTPRFCKARCSQVILPGSMSSPLYDYQKESGREKIGLSNSEGDPS